MQLQHCQTGQIVHSIDDERLTQRGNINCYRMQWTFVESLQYECQVESLQEESWKLADSILQQQAK